MLVSFKFVSFKSFSHKSCFMVITGNVPDPPD